MQKVSSLRKCMGIGSGLLVMLFLILILAACGAASGTTPGSPTTTSASKTPGSTATTSANPTGTPEVSLGVQPCPGNTGDPAYWQAIIGTSGGPLKVQSVS